MSIQHLVNQIQKQKYQDVNLRGTHAIISTGGGHSSLKKFCSTMDLPAPVTSHQHNSHLKKLCHL